MSRGIGGSAKKVLEDEKDVLYEYGGYNLNDPVYRNPDHILDGVLYIRKECLTEPRYREKRGRWNGKKRRMIKWVDVEIPSIPDLLRRGLIEIETCGNCWSRDNEGHDQTALRLLYKLLREYQHFGVLPEAVSYDI